MADTDNTQTPAAVTDVENAVTQAATDVATTVATGTVDAVATQADAAVNTAVDAVDSAASTAVDDAKQAVDTAVHLSLITEFETKVRAIGGDIESFFKKMVDDVKAAIAKL